MFEIAPIIQIGTFLLNFLIVPAVLLLWRLNENIHRLEVTLHKDFVTHSALTERLMGYERRASMKEAAE